MRRVAQGVVACLLAILVLKAGEMDPTQYWETRDGVSYVVATNKGGESGYMAVVIPTEDWVSSGREAPAGAVKIDAETVSSYLYFHPSEFPREKGEFPSEEAIEFERNRREKAYFEACKKAGLVLPRDDKQTIMLFEVGTVAIRVDRVIKGAVTQGQQLILKWNRPYRKSCPPFTPPDSGQYLYQLVLAQDGKTVAFFDGCEVAYLPRLEAKLSR
ncbi:hypothetical protein [Verrucomicrobium sp. BvORR106]|uniref:hypothetical protein n=1 Tax=Verrucomicrobium sp. BvORR106 TaxID=1403819 RepID=UPI002240F7A4|nr:hypothetical protein [Verrucomicrobium sp. BvORR106]